MAEKKTRHESGSTPTSVRLTAKCTRLWEKLSVETGLSKTGVLETAIREMAERKGVTDDGPEENK